MCVNDAFKYSMLKNIKLRLGTVFLPHPVFVMYILDLFSCSHFFGYHFCLYGAPRWTSCTKWPRWKSDWRYTLSSFLWYFGNIHWEGFVSLFSNLPPSMTTKLHHHQNAHMRVFAWIAQGGRFFKSCFFYMEGYCQYICLQVMFLSS